MRAIAATVLVLLSLAGCSREDGQQPLNDGYERVSCALAKRCIKLYDGGRLVKVVKDPVSSTMLTRDPQSGVGWTDARGVNHIWSGTYMIITRGQ